VEIGKQMADEGMPELERAANALHRAYLREATATIDVPFVVGRACL
jgi:hypothetical protein